MSDRLPTLIVGGGIGGLATALALGRSGREVHVIEKSPEFGEIGAGLQLGPNATCVLERLGLMAEIGRRAVFPSRLVWMDAISAERITAVDLRADFRRRYGHPYIVMHRGDLLSVLLEACRQERRITLESRREVVAVEDLGEAAAGALCRWRPLRDGAADRRRRSPFRGPRAHLGRCAGL